MAALDNGHSGVSKNGFVVKICNFTYTSQKTCIPNQVETQLL